MNNKWAWILGFLIGMLIFSRCESFNAYLMREHNNHKVERQLKRTDTKNKGKTVKNKKHKKSIKKEVR